jgi:DNA-directed RNA polymerase specialized sigma24 family protein
MEGKISPSNTDTIHGLKNREVSSLKKLHDKYVLPLSGVITWVVPNEETGNEILKKTFIEAWNEAESYEPSQTSVFIWLLRISMKVMAEQMNIQLLEMQNKVYHAYRELKAKEEKQN